MVATVVPIGGPDCRATLQSARKCSWLIGRQASGTDRLTMKSLMYGRSLCPASPVFSDDLKLFPISSSVHNSGGQSLVGTTVVSIVSTIVPLECTAKKSIAEPGPNKADAKLPPKIIRTPPSLCYKDWCYVIKARCFCSPPSVQLWSLPQNRNGRSLWDRHRDSRGGGHTAGKEWI
jgi:hypothetical protein